MAVRKISRAQRVFVREVLGDLFLVVRYFGEKLSLFEVLLWKGCKKKSVLDFDLLHLTVNIWILNDNFGILWYTYRPRKPIFTISFLL